MNGIRNRDSPLRDASVCARNLLQRDQHDFRWYLEGTYAIKDMEEMISRFRKWRKTEDSCRSDASILKSMRGVVSNADWYAIWNLG